ncbi:unnamed protein product [Orchesella dallaii]|uniref:Uncharacterized protein n=1 Tax=Orchesella dallaii TaxID=48710 RepID=A0ABP1RGN2_9HEXA
MFPDVKELDITDNIVVIFYTFMTLLAVAFAVFAGEYLCGISILDLIKNQTRSLVGKCNQSSQSTMETPNNHGIILVDLATDQPPSDVPICDILPANDQPPSDVPICDILPANDQPPSDVPICDVLPAQ